MKENPQGLRFRRGKALRRLTTILLALIAASCLMLLFLKWKNGTVPLPTTNSLNHRDMMIADDGSKENQNLRRKESDVVVASTNDDKNEDPNIQAVLRADYALVDVHVLENVTFLSPSSSYTGISAVFCALNWTIQKEQPDLTPMYARLVSKSKHCDKPFVMDLHSASRLVRQHDDDNNANKEEQQQSTTGSGSNVRLLNMSGLIFHQSRCGSTLVANLLTVMNRAQHRVYSEPEPPAHVLIHLESGRLNRDQAIRVLRDVVYLMRRSSDPNERHTFFKLQSTMGRYFPLIQQALPDAPWMFLYRESVQVIMSYIRDKNYRHAFCQGGAVRGLPPIHNPPPNIQDMIQRHVPPGSSFNLTYEGYCAANIATVTEPILEEMNNNGFVINYNSLTTYPQELYEKWRSHWGLSIDPTAVQQMHLESTKYSKGRGRASKEFVSDSQAKEDAAWDRVEEAAELFLGESYNLLETAAQYSTRWTNNNHHSS